MEEQKFLVEGHLDAAKEQLEALSQELEQKMTGMFTVCSDLNEGNLKADWQMVRDGPTSPRLEGQIETNLNPGAGEAGHFDVAWYWEEDSENIDKHDPHQVLRGTTFVAYSHAVSNTLEDEYHKHISDSAAAPVIELDLDNRISSTGTEKKAHNEHTGALFSLDFGTMKQTNATSGYQRNVRREVTDILQKPAQESPQQQLEGAAIARSTDLPPLPEDIDFGEDGQTILPARQVRLQRLRCHRDV